MKKTKESKTKAVKVRGASKIDNSNKAERASMTDNVSRAERARRANNANKKSNAKTSRIEKQAAIIIFISILIIAAVFIFLFTKKPYFNYEGFKVYPVAYGNLVFYSIPVQFYASDGIYTRNVVLRNDPRKIKIESSFNESMLEMKSLGIVMSPEAGADIWKAAIEISKFSKNFVPTDFAFLYTIENKNVSIASCENATAEARIIMLEISNKTEIKQHEKYPCIIISAENYEKLTEAADKFVIEWLLSMKK